MPKFIPAGWNRGKGKAIAWLREHAAHTGDDCLIWPFYRLPNGYGQLGYDGHVHYAHRFICALAHGSPPTQKHEAAHSCGKGHEGCVNPRHLSWKTISQNLLDCRKHGTQARSYDGKRGRLTPIQVHQIRALKGTTRQSDIATMFKVSEPTVRDIFLGRSHRRT